MLLAAELRKLARPLVWGTGLAAVAFVVLLTLGATGNARSSIVSPDVPRSCATDPTPQCQQLLVIARHGAVLAHRQEMPGRVGEVAAGMLASMPGVVLVALLAGAHVGGEWSGRTIRTVLTHEGRRVRVLGAKWLSLWLAMVAIMVACWAALAVAGPLLGSLYRLPATGTPLFAGFASSASQFARGTLVLGLFALIGVMAGVLTRNTVGTIAVVVGAVVVFLIVGGIASLARWSPATSVQAWMGFTFNGAFLPTNFWSRFERGAVHLTSMAGFLGLLATGAVAAIIAAWRMGADVTV